MEVRSSNLAQGWYSWLIPYATLFTSVSPTTPKHPPNIIQDPITIIVYVASH